MRIGLPLEISTVNYRSHFDDKDEKCNGSPNGMIARHCHPSIHPRSIHPNVSFRRQTKRRHPFTATVPQIDLLLLLSSLTPLRSSPLRKWSAVKQSHHFSRHVAFELTLDSATRGNLGRSRREQAWFCRNKGEKKPCDQSSERPEGFRPSFRPL